MEERWNFMGYVALPMEELYVPKYLGGKLFVAGEIADGKFVEVMLQILSATYGDLTQVDDFVKQCKKYKGLSYNNIPKETAQALFDDFKWLMEKYERGQEQ